MAFGGDPHGEGQQTFPANLAEAGVDSLVRDTLFSEGRLDVLVEAGAASPYSLSLGNSLGGCGLRLIRVESDLCREASRAWARDPGVGCGDEGRDVVPFLLAHPRNLGSQDRGREISYDSFSSLGIRGDFKNLFDTMVDRFTTREFRVQERRMDTILGAIDGLDSVDVQSIDAEVCELECLNGFSFERFRPKVLLSRICSVGGRLMISLDPWLCPLAEAHPEQCLFIARVGFHSTL